MGYFYPVQRDKNRTIDIARNLCDVYLMYCKLGCKWDASDIWMFYVPWPRLYVREYPIPLYVCNCHDDANSMDSL